MVCICGYSDLVYRRVFDSWYDFESDHEKCMGTQNLGERHDRNAYNQYNHSHFITMSNNEIYKFRALACMPKGSLIVAGRPLY